MTGINKPTIASTPASARWISAIVGLLMPVIARTDVCLTFPALDALRDGFEVYPVVDPVGGTSPEAHKAGLKRIVQAGAPPVSWVQLICELQRDWNRSETAKGFAQILFPSGE
jgi:nicotinamidase-related amidase